MECNLPDLSVCQICKGFLKAKSCSLGNAANDAVHHFKGTDDSEDHLSNDANKDEDSDDDLIEDEQQQQPDKMKTILQLIDKMNAWRRLEDPRS
jgi:hypothetical protein